MRADRPNDTREYDLALIRGRLDDGRTTLNRALDVARDEWIGDFRADGSGHFFFGGYANAVQVDTRSWVEPGEGLVLVTDGQGARLAEVRLPGPRQVSVSRLVPGPGGKVYFGGLYDAPITHTPMDQRSDKRMLGVVKF